MAIFTYHASYNGKIQSSGLSREIINSIEAARTSGQIDLIKSPQEGANIVYKYGLVRFEVLSFPGKSEGSETVEMQFCGPERLNLQTKSELLEIVKELKLE